MRAFARTTDPISSHLAANFASHFAGTHNERILRCLQEHGANSKDGIAKLTGLTGVQVDRRLATCPGIRRTERTTKSDSGVPEFIWEAVRK